MDVGITTRVSAHFVPLSVIKCGRVGHSAPVCRSRTFASRPRNTPQATKWVDSTTDSTGEPSTQVEPLFIVKDKVTPPYSVEVKVNGLPLHVEVDSGAAVSLATEMAVASLLTSTKLHPSNTVQKTYTGNQIPVKGVMRVDVSMASSNVPSLTCW